MKRNTIPFQVSRNDSRTLVCQVTDGLRQLVLGGFYSPGDTLPPYDELSRSLGVSQIVTRAAVRTLSDEGLVVVRPRLGTVVRDRGAKQWRGHVVFVGFTDDGNFFQAVFAGVLRARLMAAGYLFTEATLSWDTLDNIDFSALDAALSRSVDLIIARNSDRRVFRHIEKRKTPCISIGDAGAFDGIIGTTRYDRNSAAAPFVAECARLGVEEVVEVTWKNVLYDVIPECRKAGLNARKIMAEVPGDISSSRLEATRHAGMEAAMKLAESGQLKAGNPYRVIFFADDYLASGALLAFALAGIETPRDIRVATWANKGLVPVYPRELSRMEIDPVASGELVATSALEYLRTGTYPSGTVIGPRWIPGETLFPPRHDGAGETTNDNHKTRRSKP